MKIFLHKNQLVSDFEGFVFNKTKSGHISLHDRILIFLKGLCLSFELLGRAKNLNERVIILKEMTHAMLDPFEFLPKKDEVRYLLLAIEEDISSEIEELVEGEEFSDFSQLKRILNGQDDQFINSLTQKLRKKYEKEFNSERGLSISDELIEERIMHKFEQVAEEAYLIDRQTLLEVRQKRAMHKIVQSIEAYDKGLFHALPEVTCALKDLTKEDLIKNRTIASAKLKVTKNP